ncbi:hypothetical protein ES703_04075 [subsurface metagenome]
MSWKLVGLSGLILHFAGLSRARPNTKGVNGATQPFISSSGTIFTPLCGGEIAVSGTYL